MQDALLFFIISLHAFTALLWYALARSYCNCHGTTRPRGALRLFSWMAWMFAIHYLGKTLLDFRLEIDTPFYWLLCIVSEVTIVFLLVLLRHLIPLGVLGGPRPGRLWLATNYGLGVIGLFILGAFTLPYSGTTIDGFDIYLTVLTSLILWDILRSKGVGRRLILMADLPLRGYVAIAVILFVGVVILGLTEKDSFNNQQPLWLITHILVGLTAAMPFALRNLGEVLRTFLLDGLRLGFGIGLFALFRILGSIAGSDGALGPLWVGDLLAGLIAFAALDRGTPWLSERIDRIVLRQDHDWRRKLQGALREMAPDIGIEAVSRRAAREVAELLHVPGVGILLQDAENESLDAGGIQAASDQETSLKIVTVGELDLTPITEVWPHLTTPPPRGAYDLVWLDDEKLQAALHDARVTWVVSIESPRRSWGYLFVAAGWLGSGASHARLDSLEDFARGLGLVLEASDLMSRARRAERELARSEKLAALGETAARLAHEIRNPLTAARSLAQLMAQEPTSAQNEEHGALVVQELDRVEERVRAMLQFARQEDLCLAAVDLGELVKSTLHELENYLTRESTETFFERPGEPMRVAGDRERLRQILVNLISNAVEAQAAAPRIHFDVSRSADSYELRVRDRGPGVNEQLQGRLFEPFVSSKAKGTGLGLAISKRIAEAHGGDLDAFPAPDGGMIFRLRLPRLESAPTSAMTSQKKTELKEAV